MKYIFMNKNKPILECEVSKNYNGEYEIIEVDEILKAEYRPIHIKINKGIIDKKVLNKWFTDRKIPASRQNIDEILKKYDLYKTDDLILKHFALSLSDQYWFKPANMEIELKDINFFQNDFSEDIGKNIFTYNDLSLKSPDNTSDGWLKKTWKIVNGDRVLFKGGSGLYKQEVFNEIFAYEVSKLMGFDHIEYDYVERDGEYYSICKNFVDIDTELISANYIKEIDKKPNHISNFNWYIKACEKLGIKNAKEKLSDILVLDYIIANTDRHYGNFGVLRNVESLNDFKFAPIFDSGTSMGHNFINKDLASRNYEVKPFYEDKARQIALVELKGYDFKKLNYIDDLVEDIYSKNELMEEDNPYRKHYLAEAVKERIQVLERLREKEIKYNRDLDIDL